MLVCYSEVLSHQQEVFEQLFKHALNPWVVTYPTFTKAGEFDDGWILLMNEAARLAFGYDEPVVNLRLRELSLFQSGELWTKLRDALAHADPRATIHFEQGEINLLKLKRLLALRFDRGDAPPAA